MNFVRNSYYIDIEPGLDNLCMDDAKVSLKRFQKLTDIDNAVACRDLCNGTEGCYYWTFRVILLHVAPINIKKFF